MEIGNSAARYQWLYAQLIRFYPKSHRERFGEGMGQVFKDLCQERTVAGKGLFSFVLWMFGDTFIGMISVRISYIFSFIIMHSKHVIRPALITLILLFVPFIFKQFSSEMQWTGFDFLFMGILIFGACFAFELISRNSTNVIYKFAVGIAALMTFFLMWINAAVGIIGDGPINLLYVFLPMIGLIGAGISRFEARGMSYTMFTVAVGQMLVPVIGLVVNEPDFSPGVWQVLAINAVFAMGWVFAGLLFQQSMQKRA